MFQLPAVDVVVRKSDSSSADVEILAISQDPKKKPLPPKGAYADAVSRLGKSGAFVGKSGATQFVRFGGKGAESALFVGVGATAELTEEKLRVAGGAVWARLQAERLGTVAIDFASIQGLRGLPKDLDANRVAYALLEGILLSAYKYGLPSKRGRGAKGQAAKGDAPEFVVRKISFVVADSSAASKLRKIAEELSATAAAVNLTREWSNLPSNVGIPEYYAAEARKLAREHGLSCKILTEADCRREGMGLFLGVGQGSAREGRIVVLEYKPKGVKNPQKDIKTLALVGKGITFDSGGISIKPGLRMEEMKHDMTGAATVMGAMTLIARTGAPNRVVAVMAFTENMPDGDAITPGNVLVARNGKTVEIVNTDAEGRLILGDALDYAQDFKPDAVVNIATLTGAVGVALGKQCCAILGNDEALIETVKRTAESQGERMWQLPLWDEYFDDMRSDWADMRNSANDASGGTIRGGIFLKQFIRKGQAWAHLDIASMAYGVSHIPYLPKKGATGLYVRTLARLASEI